MELKIRENKFPLRKYPYLNEPRPSIISSNQKILEKIKENSLNLKTKQNLGHEYQVKVIRGELLETAKFSILDFIRNYNDNLAKFLDDKQKEIKIHNTQTNLTFQSPLKMDRLPTKKTENIDEFEDFDQLEEKSTFKKTKPFRFMTFKDLSWLKIDLKAEIEKRNQNKNSKN